MTCIVHQSINEIPDWHDGVKSPVVAWESETVQKWMEREIGKLLPSTKICVGWEAHLLMGRCYVMGISRVHRGEIFTRLIPGEVTATETRPVGPERCTNRDTAFETWAQRVQGRRVTIKLVTPTPDGEPFWSHSFPWGDPTEARVEVELGEWEEGILVDGSFEPYPANVPAVVSNTCLPTVGEKVVV